MAEQINEDDLVAAIVAVTDGKSRDGLTPQGEAAVRLALLAARAPKVEIVETLGQPTTCKVFVKGVLVFAGRDYSADLRVPASPGEMDLPADQHYPVIPVISVPVSEILDAGHFTDSEPETDNIPIGQTEDETPEPDPDWKVDF